MKSPQKKHEYKERERKESSWREFERLVSRVEVALAPHGALVTSPDRLLDRITKETREVDASIRYKVGTIDILIIVECRERKKVQDSLWIEQLASKQQSVGAAKCIAVTSSGFSRGAVRKAEAYGIELRHVKKIADETIHNWVPKRSFFYKYKLGRLDFAFEPEGVDTDKQNHQLDDQIMSELLRKHTVNSPIAIGKKTGQPASLRRLCEEAFNYAYGEVEESKRWSVPLNEWLAMSLAGDPTHFIECSRGRFNIICVAFEIRFSNFVDFALSNSVAFTYEDAAKRLVKGFEMEITSNDGKKRLVTVHQDLTSDARHVRLWDR